MRTFPGITIACALIIQGCAARTADSVSAAKPARASADSAQIHCREIQGPYGPVLECPEFDLIVSLDPSEPLPLATLSKVMAAGGLTTTESVLMIGGSQHPALRIEKQRSDGRKQIGWATTVAINGVERNVTCYLHPPYTEEKICTEGLLQLSKGQLRLMGN